MKKIFENYGGVIAVCIAFIALIALIGLMLTGSSSGGGWVGNAYNGLVTGLADKVDIPDGSTDYSHEVIVAKPLLYAIGKTKPEHVVAEFNEDFTSVTITKNGEDSDGTMKRFSVGTINPFADHSGTLSNVIVADGITNIGYRAFSHCTNLTTLTTPDSVTIIENDAFSNCTSLTSVTIPDSVTTIGNSAFSNCTSLTSATIPDSVTTIGSNAFYHCIGLTSIAIPDSVKSIGSNAFMFVNGFFTIYCETDTVADLLIAGKNYPASISVVVDASKF